MIFVSGTVHSAVKLAQLEHKWQQKKEEGNVLKKDMDPQMRQIKQFQEDLAKMRENGKMTEITNKIKSGAELTPEEIDYLKRNNPTAYQDYVEVRQEKESYENELRNCGTKDEVERLRVTRLGQFAAQAKQIQNNPNIPEGKKVQLMGKILAKTMGIEKIHHQFTESAAYHALPTEEESVRKRRYGMEETRLLGTELQQPEETDGIKLSETESEKAEKVSPVGTETEQTEGIRFLEKKTDDTISGNK